MRIGANLILKDGLACQSHNWEFYRPIGPLNLALDALSRYQVDEINIISLDYRTKKDLKHSINSLMECACSTPITFGGGISFQNMNLILEALPAERYSFCSSVIANDLRPIEQVTKKLGRQSVVGCMPVKLSGHFVEIYYPKENRFIEMTKSLLGIFTANCDELLVYDVEADGQKKGFNFKLLEKLQIAPSKTIISGGITKKDVNYAELIGLCAVQLDNSILHYENGGDFL